MSKIVIDKDMIKKVELVCEDFTQVIVPGTSIIYMQHLPIIDDEVALCMIFRKKDIEYSSMTDEVDSDVLEAMPGTLTQIYVYMEDGYHYMHFIHWDGDNPNFNEGEVRQVNEPDFFTFTTDNRIDWEDIV